VARPRRQARTNLAPGQARQLLNRLATDDAFRTQVEQDPVGTLGAEGVTLEGDIPESPTLPTQDEVQQMINEADASNVLGDPNNAQPHADLMLKVVVGAIPFVAAEPQEGDGTG
jgi:putative modified peptide